MTAVTTRTRPSIGIKRHFSTPGVHPYDTVTWVIRDALIMQYGTDEIAFEQKGVEVPEGWSLNATNILAQKYFRGTPNTDEREFSLKQVVDRIVDTLTVWGIKDGYFDEDEAEIWSAEYKYILIHQMAAPNSPVWFNIGVEGVPQQGSACFILSVQDTMDSILNWYTEEGNIFKGGSGAGVNLSKIRSSAETLKGGGTASGPVSFMRGADASAGTIKSGGKTRRAAKMVILDSDHPDILDFIECKAVEERKARVLRDAGFEMDLDGRDTISLQYQNANNSVRVTDEFMEAVIDGRDWALTARGGDHETIETVPAREIMRRLSQAAWECADPGMQFHTTINKWNTAATTGPINGSNPCSEYMHLDNSACNLASLNLMKYLNDDDSFDIEGYRHAIEVVFLAQEILVGNSDYPTKKIGQNARRFRQLGLGYANIGALLMAWGLPYDSDEGRARAATLTAIMTGHAYTTSAKIAARVGPFAGYRQNKKHMLHVLSLHRDEVSSINGYLVPDELIAAARQDWDDAVVLGEQHGVRNAQASVLAPTGTIGLLMDCDTTGVEPDLGLVKTKKLVAQGKGASTMEIVNQTVPRALRQLGYTTSQVDQILAYIKENKSIVDAPEFNPAHLPVFACSMGDNTIHYRGHIRMMGAVQPFLSGAISKTVNLPQDVTVEDIEQVFQEAWKLKLKAVAIYRDHCKVGQPLSVTQKEVEDEFERMSEAIESPVLRAEFRRLRALVGQEVIEANQSYRERLPRRRKSHTRAFQVGDCEGYVTVGEYEDGRPGEVFMKVSKQGSTLAGIMDGFSIAVSLGLQYGVPLATLVSKYTNTKFEPAGATDDPELRIASSLTDYIFRRLAVDYLPLDVRELLNVATSDERIAQLKGQNAQGIESATAAELPKTNYVVDAPMCSQCGNVMQRSGSCFVCVSCGTTSGCS